MVRRQQLVTSLIIGVSFFIGISFVLAFRGSPEGTRHPSMAGAPAPNLDNSLLHGTSVVPKLGNETLKAELGNAGWKMLHTTMAKFPDKPSADDSSALKSYVYLFARLYPCGECGRHFQQILQKFPPQVSSRTSAATWACHVHNEVNKSLKKKLFDCSKIGDFYDCGCAEDDEPAGAIKTTKEVKEGGFTPLELEKGGLTNGG